ncbi:hypothetical protein HLPCO_000646 [Haloplasma contractile SSD-17B]|uniref:Uncharacterized protein n=1 Tax=Haloplasma contractile SSD-17B TaxID=1033810 RepID=U2DXQ9_9MOLU|nr:hypothetical protein HLPCO_000646 [Haloplasma contractile SSD-17B]
MKNIVRNNDIKLYIFLIISIIIFISIENFRDSIFTFDNAYYIERNIRERDIFFIILFTNLVLLTKLAKMIIKNKFYVVSTYSLYSIYFLTLIFVTLDKKILTEELIVISEWNNLYLAFSKISFMFYPLFILLCLWGLIMLILKLIKYRNYKLTVFIIPITINIMLPILLLISNSKLEHPYFIYSIYIPITAIINILAAIAVLFLYPSKQST